MQIIDNPKILPDWPMICFSDHTSGLIEYAIKIRTRGIYNHVMWTIRPGYFVSQGNTYSEAKMERYMKKGNRLYFFKVVGLTEEQRALIKRSIERKLALPWYKKMYDWVGILGQAIGIKKLNIEGLNYCSEDVVFHLRAALLYETPEQKELCEVIKNVPRHEHPQGLFDYFYHYPQHFERFAYYEHHLPSA